MGECMIKTKKEYDYSREQLKTQKSALTALETNLKSQDLDDDKVRLATSSLRGVVSDIEAELHEYDSIRSGRLPATVELSEIGRLLIALRLSRGVTQRDLAAKLGVHESQVSRDEREEYRTASADRIARVLDAFHATVTCSVVR